MSFILLFFQINLIRSNINRVWLLSIILNQTCHSRSDELPNPLKIFFSNRLLKTGLDIIITCSIYSIEQAERTSSNDDWQVNSLYHWKGQLSLTFIIMIENERSYHSISTLFEQDDRCNNYFSSLPIIWPFHCLDVVFDDIIIEYYIS